MGSLRSLSKKPRKIKSGVSIKQLNWRLVQNDQGFLEIVEGLKSHGNVTTVWMVAKTKNYTPWGSFSVESPNYRYCKGEIQVRCECGYVSNRVFIRPDTREITCVSCLNPYWGTVRGI